MWIITAWQCISPQVILKSFKNCCPSKAGDKSDDDIPWNDSEEEWNVRCECKEDEGTD
jgi:hypothetical protein